MKKRLTLSALLGTGLVTLASFAWDMGEPIVTYWAGPGFKGSRMAITDESLKLLKEGGFNLVWASSKEDLDLIAKWGLRAICRSELSGLNPQTKGNADTNNCDEIKDFAGHPFKIIKTIGQIPFTAEGVRKENLYGISLIGPVLVKNPFFADHLTRLIVERRKAEYKEVYYKHEERGYDMTLRALS